MHVHRHPSPKKTAAILGDDASRESRGRDLIARLTADLVGARSVARTLRKSDRRKDAFLATISHELRGPLATISNALMLLDRNPDDPAIGSWAREVMHRNLTHLTHLTDDLLDLNRINHDKVTLHRVPVALQTIIRQSIEGCRPSLYAKQIRSLEALPDEAIFIQADAMRLTQVFTNLIHNACKFTAPTGEIGILVELAGAEAVVRVRDSGKGIPLDSLDSIFQLFGQEASSADQSDGGLGVGLYLVRRLVEMHGGTVTASSAGLGHGSEFAVKLPATIQCPSAEHS